LDAINPTRSFFLKNLFLSLSEITQKLLADVKLFTWPELISSLAQIISVWYAKKNNILVYPSGIIGVLLGAYVCFNAQLYADGGLNIYYFIMSVYGWYHWVQKKENQFEYPIQWCTVKERTAGVAFFLVSWVIIFFVLKNYTNSNVPILDSLVSASAITAMWWMAKRKIENWIAWIFSNIVAIPLFFYKGLILFTFMYIIFLILAWLGFLEWKKKAVI
jgi:nicotinamide mononucleotide transporter